MGIQDREWYWKDRDAKAREAASNQVSKQPTKQDPDALIRRVNGQPPKLWGSDWHWSIQLLVWLCIVVLLLLIWRIVR